MRLFRRNVGAAAPPKTQASSSQALAPRRAPGHEEAKGSGARLASVTIAVTIQRLMEDASRDWLLEEELVLQALRRSTRALEDADAGEIAAYLGGLNEAQLRGVISNVKGIYHELLFVQAENADMDEVSAEVMGFTNHPGSDVAFSVDGQGIGEVQLKAVQSEGAVLEALALYPDVEIRVTEEVAAGMPGVVGSGFYNNVLERDVRERLEELKGDGVIEEVGEGLATSAFVSAAIIASKAVRGREVCGAQLRGVLVDAGVGATTALAIDAILFPISG